MMLVPLKLSLTIWHKFNIRLWWINIGFVSCASYFIFNKICGKICNKSLYYCSDIMVLVKSVKQTTFKRSGSSNGSVVLTTFSSILNSEHLGLFSSLPVNSSVCSSRHLHNFLKFAFIALSVGCPAMCSVSVPFMVGVHFFVKNRFTLSMIYCFTGN